MLKNKTNKTNKKNKDIGCLFFFGIISISSILYKKLINFRIILPNASSHRIVSYVYSYHPMSFEKDNITLTMKEAIKNGNEKIKQRKNANANAKTMVVVMEQQSTSISDAESSATVITHINKNGIEEQPQPHQQQRCNGEKKKGGQCSRKAKKGGFCETHSTDRKEMERKLEGGIYVYRCKNDLYDIEEIRKRGMV